MINNRRPAIWKYPLAWCLYGVCWLLAQLPYSWLLFIGQGIGRLFALLVKSRIRVIEKNLATCFPDMNTVELKAVVKRNCLETGMMLSQTIKAFFAKNNQLFDQLGIEGQEYLTKVLDQGQGVLLVSGHFTALDVGGRVICQHFPVAGVYRPHKHPVMEYVVKKARKKYATKMFSRDELKSIVRYLKAGGVVWYAPDQNYRRGQSIFVDFFGTPAATITATHQLARMTQCRVMFYSVVRLPNRPYYRLSIKPALEDFPSTDVVKDTLRVNHAIESLVQEAPEQYLWMHKRFKTRPKGEHVFYD